MIVIKIYYIDLKKHNIDKKQGSEILKKAVLGEKEIFKTEKGKPCCDGIYFNISHSGDFAVLGVADSEIGIDIEKIREIDLKIAYRCFNEEESVKTKEEFFEMWTKKESIIKFLGKSITSIKEINSKNYSHLLKQSDFFKDYAFCICSEDKTEIEYIEITKGM